MKKSPTEEVKIVCAWCNKSLGFKEMILNQAMKGVPSHGICPECLEDMQNQMNEVKVNENGGK